ncbi:MAG TPA: preprotein translocase subunit SecG [Pontiella sp.]
MEVFLKSLFIVIVVLSSLLLIGLILLQKSKSEGLGLAFGAGAGESLFGARAGNVLSKATVVLGGVFLASSLILGILFARQETALMDSVESDSLQPIAMQPTPVEDLNFATPEASEVSSDAIPELDVSLEAPVAPAE